MSLVSILGKQMVADLLSPRWKERRFDLGKLASVSRRAGNETLAGFLEALGRDMDRGAGLARVAARVGGALAPACRRKAADNLAWNWAIEGARIQRLDGTPGLFPAPAILVPTQRCNLSCPGCGSSRPGASRGELTAARVSHLIQEARRGGRFLVVVTGGEPFLRPDLVLDAARRHEDMYFLVFTNGTIMDRDLARRLAEVGNVALALTVLGSRDATDRVRGRGAYRRAAAAMRFLAREGVPFGIAPRHNGQAAASFAGDDFVRRMLRGGALFALYARDLRGAEDVMERHPLLAVRLAPEGPFPLHCTLEAVATQPVMAVAAGPATPASRPTPDDSMAASPVV